MTDRSLAVAIAVNGIVWKDWFNYNATPTKGDSRFVNKTKCRLNITHLETTSAMGPLAYHIAQAAAASPEWLLLQQ